MEFDVPSTEEGIEEAIALLEAFLIETTLSEMARGQCSIGLQEGVRNAHQHGNRGRPGSRIRLAALLGHESIEFRVADDGAGFDPRPYLVQAERLREFPTARGRPCGPEIGGLGIMMMERIFSSVDYSARGNEVRLVYRHDADPDRGRCRYEIHAAVLGEPVPAWLEIRPGPAGRFSWVLGLDRPPVPTRIQGSGPGEPDLARALAAIRSDRRIAKMRLAIDDPA